MSYPYTILVGNSPNLLSNPWSPQVSWETITRKLEETYREILGDEPFSLTDEYSLSSRMGHLQNLLQEEKRKLRENWTKEQIVLVSALEAAWDNWYNALLHLKCGCVHVLIAKWVLEKNAALITTNYDLTFERALVLGNLPSVPSMRQKDISSDRVREETAENAFRLRWHVWHMHGDASCPASIVAGKSSCDAAIDGLRGVAKKQGSWLYQFLHSTVFICGLELRSYEKILMRALHFRAELQKWERHPVFYFHFCRKGDAEGRKTVIQLLKGLDVEFIEIPVYADDQGGFDYQSAWHHLMKRIWEYTAQDSIATSRPSKSPMPDDQSWQCISPALRNIPADCIVRTSTPTKTNPDRCWINIVMKKLRANWGKDWFFECRIDGKLYVYHYPAHELERIFVQKKVTIIKTGTWRYNLYIDYRRGKLYSTLPPSNEVPLVVLKRVAG